MANNLTDHIRGVVRVPLDLLAAQGIVEIPQTLCDSATTEHFQQILASAVHPICAVVNNIQLESIEEEIRPLKLLDTLRLEAPSPSIKVRIACLLGQKCIDEAIHRLGPKFECRVKIYYIPPGKIEVRRVERY